MNCLIEWIRCENNILVKFVNCSKCGEYKPHHARGLCRKCYGKEIKYNISGNNKYRTKMGKYYAIYKPYFKYCYPDGRVKEHRYIMYIYLSIINNKIIYLSKDDDVHHINKDKLDNRIENLQLITRSEHAKITHPIVDKSDRFCNICHTDKTFKNKHYDNWYEDIEGHLCSICYKMLRRLIKRFENNPKIS